VLHASFNFNESKKHAQEYVDEFVDALAQGLQLQKQSNRRDPRP
jgi:hypothetical protein